MRKSNHFRSGNMQQVTNLPLEIKILREQLTEKDKQLKEYSCKNEILKTLFEMCAIDDFHQKSQRVDQLSKLINDSHENHDWSKALVYDLSTERGSWFTTKKLSVILALIPNAQSERDSIQKLLNSSGVFGHL